MARRMTRGFYDKSADAYHLVFEDWDAAVHRQGRLVAALLPPPVAVGPVLDCACGIGTQALGLAALGYAVEGSDASPAAVARARREALAHGLAADFRVDDMRRLAAAPPARYGAVLAMDNALPHLDSDAEIAAALGAMRSRLRPGGTLLLSLRDYGPLMAERPAGTPPAFFRDAEGRRRIVHQVWDWHDERRYTVHLHLTREATRGRWEAMHFAGEYRAVTPAEVAALAVAASFCGVKVLGQAETGFYQPIVAAMAP
jgi:glycine/sarcosine N-methyltransferase